MSTGENKAVAERLINAFNERNFDQVEEIFSPDYVNHNPPPFPGLGGDRESQVRAIRGMAEGIPDARAKIHHLVAEGDTVVVHDLVRGTHQGELAGVPPTGREVTAEFIHIFRIREGRIVERWGLINTLELMQQLGAIPQPAQA
jgi:steroid delta-isomerase-like uncharacterized protein